jgi:hypothetical protein
MEARLSRYLSRNVYNRQYWFRLISAVSEDFPTLSALQGLKRFDALILAYLAENPSMSWTLRDLGSTLPAFLDAHPGFTGRRHRLAADAHMLFGLKDNDPASIVMAVGLLLAVGIVAGYFPARRASQVDPIVALRYE